MAELSFSDRGPFDEEERAVIRDVVDAVCEERRSNWDGLVDKVRRNIEQLDRFAEVLCDYPSLFTKQSFGKRSRDLSSLVNLLSRSNLSNFEMFLPTRALLARNVVMGEVNFYRSLRHVCDEALRPAQASAFKTRIDRRLCHSLYTRLAEEVLIHIASDSTISRTVRDPAVVALSYIWEQTAYRVSDFFPVLQATWEARRSVPVVLGTLMGTREMFSLLQAGCDERFVDYLVRPSHTENEAAAFREFLFGATTEQLERMQEHMACSGKHVISKEELADIDRPTDVCAIGADPALAMFEFFLVRRIYRARSARPKST